MGAIERIRARLFRVFQVEAVWDLQRLGVGVEILEE